MIDVFSLMRNWFDFCFENPEKITPTHTALYFFCIEHCNRLGWKEKFGLPMEMAKDAIGIKNYRTYRRAFDDIVDWGFIKVVQRSKNQYSSNIIAIAKNTKATTNALSRAMQKHDQKHDQEQCNRSVCIDIPNTIIPNTKIPNTHNASECDSSSDILNVKNEIDLIMDHFKFNEQNHFNHLRTITHFCTTLMQSGSMDHFRTQFDAYNRYKAITGQVKHGFRSFLGSPDENYMDGGWNAENWSDKLTTAQASPAANVEYNVSDQMKRIADQLKSTL